VIGVKRKAKLAMAGSTLIRSPAEAAEHHDGACAVALRYLAAMEMRDLAAADRLVAADLELVFPGNTIRRDLGEIIAGSAKRYRRIGKHIEGCDVNDGRGGMDVVYIFGTLYGQWLDGTDFAGIRFVDRLELRDGLIRRQDVWNDSAEWRMLECAKSV